MLPVRSDWDRVAFTILENSRHSITSADRPAGIYRLKHGSSLSPGDKTRHNFAFYQRLLASFYSPLEKCILVFKSFSHVDTTHISEESKNQAHQRAAGKRGWAGSRQSAVPGLPKYFSAYFVCYSTAL
jgi:hypothetical protein